MFVGAHFQLIKMTLTVLGTCPGCSLQFSCHSAPSGLQEQFGNQTATRGAVPSVVPYLCAQGTEHQGVSTVQFPVPVNLALSRFAAHPA